MIIKEVIHMVYEMRIYHIATGKRKELENRFQNVTFSLLENTALKYVIIGLMKKEKRCAIFVDSATVLREASDGRPLKRIRNG